MIRLLSTFVAALGFVFVVSVLWTYNVRDTGQRSAPASGFAATDGIAMPRIGQATPWQCREAAVRIEELALLIDVFAGMSVLDTAAGPASAPVSTLNTAPLGYAWDLAKAKARTHAEYYAEMAKAAAAGCSVETPRERLRRIERSEAPR